LHPLPSRIAELAQCVSELEALVAQLLKNSRNSSKPPSSDIVKPPKPKDKDWRRKKKIGGRKGYKQNLRTPFVSDQIDETIELKLESCPKCGGELEPTDEPSRGHEVLVKILGKDFAGTISCDFFSTYQKFAKESKAEVLLCWAHLIREVKFISESKDKKVARYGKRLLDTILGVIGAIVGGSGYGQSWQRASNREKM